MTTPAQNPLQGSAGAPLLDRRTQGLITMAALCILVAALKLASDLIVPVLLAAFFAMALTPLGARLQRAGVPAALAVICSFLIGAALVLGVALLVTVATADVKDKLPEYQARIETGVENATSWLHERGVEIPEDGFDSMIDPGKAVGLAAGLLGSVGSALSNAIVVLLAMLFMMFEGAALTGKVPGQTAQGVAATKFQRITQSVTDYLSVKTIISIITGLLFGVACALIGVDFPVLWGLLAFLLNYIPNIGSVLAAVPPILIALVQPGLGITGAVLVLVATLAINGILGNVIEPKMMGQKVGLSTLTVFLGLLFWSWVFGPVGTVLSVPLTIVAKMALERPAVASEPLPA